MLAGLKEEKMPRVTCAERAREGPVEIVVKMWVAEVQGLEVRKVLQIKARTLGVAPNEMGSH